MKYKIGDKVRIREDLIVGEDYGRDTFVKGMKKYIGREASVVDIDDLSEYELDIDDFAWSWTDEMLESID